MNRLFRPVAAACALLCLAAGAQAQTAVPTTNVKLYGLVDMSVGRFQDPGTERIYRAESGSMSTSYLGFNGVEDLGGGLQARFALEAFHRTDTGMAGRFPTDVFFARNAFVGLSGAFGTTQLGRNTTPLFVSTLAFNAFGDSFGFSPSIRHYFTALPLPAPVGSIPGTPPTPTSTVGDSGWSNSLLYTNQIGGLSFTLLGNLGEGSPNAVGRNLSASVTYFSGPFGVTVVGQQVKNTTGPLPAGFEKQDTFQIGGSYDFNVAKVFGQYGEVRTHSALATVESKSKISGLGLAVPVGAGRILGQVGYSKTTGPANSGSLRIASVGYDYNLSKSTDIYAVYMNERASYVSSTGNSMAAGIRLRF